VGPLVFQRGSPVFRGGQLRGRVIGSGDAAV